ncbi:OmpA family protein [Massilia sp. CCM 8733]|uniref:OmpA family protein n=1 Tax=Massilia mucilaginosa TaxID=2609282 RepID=A0ABX0P4Y6_9BURK|nr:OmpA family protein [Massilia mucilaginosa]NHZ93825.1 OmpA family protein [Massilia mucilaginosa]
MRHILTALSLCLACALPAVVLADPPRIQFATEVYFDSGSARLSADAVSILDQVVSKRRELDPELIMAIGHTDALPSDARAQTLSVQRAEAVKRYLANKGVERIRIYTEGKAKRMPVADNDSREGRARNNRVEVQLVAPKTAPADPEQ